VYKRQAPGSAAVVPANSKSMASSNHS